MRPAKTEFQKEHYDAMYASQKVRDTYKLPYRHSGYYPLFTRVRHALELGGGSSVLEVGCGTGTFAHLLLDSRPSFGYRGFDLSAVGVESARSRTGRQDLFHVGNAKAPVCYTGTYDSIVCTEVLEHIDDDLGVIRNWSPGAWCVCSVPNFDADDHVRFFVDEKSVSDRYGRLISIEGIVRIKKPYLTDISWTSYWRALRWNRYRPGRLLKILGLASFDDLGGWFLFYGRRTSNDAD
jgi:2-polyprenyl-3-methyl-5-hydroxy-6-metoxy-1,4-benzoquinol methylase